MDANLDDSGRLLDFSLLVVIEEMVEQFKKMLIC